MLADYPTATRYCSIESSPLRTRSVKNATPNPSFVIWQRCVTDQYRMSDRDTELFLRDRLAALPKCL